MMSSIIFQLRIKPLGLQIIFTDNLKIFHVSNFETLYAEYVPSLSLLALANTISSKTFAII